ncbi:3-hydroxyacyl-CoA dehydrogenase NAD-binding domain-containing protein [Alkalilacustris brevis]|uniref:3-hydroxyacyl-CoA dehydrogenase NAD-binding domain-containing protein n=1 Tax=Alkalilacustris brevis TaxID=2026338 RepID=UPI000E0DB818|nr:3-hydroxyacyl-CoA dehydrogenase NAD-binding domain-containing protein [Alkalilacustris brevis]
MSDFHYRLGKDGVAVITWDMAARSMNVMTLAGLEDLDALIGIALDEPEAKGVVITSGKPDFAGGMDLGALVALRQQAGGFPAQGLFEGLMRIHRLFRRIEQAEKPVAAALPGTTAGIGLELALACHHIIAADRAEARIGLPEIKVGLFPGAGGTTRLVRKLGLLAAAPLLLEGGMLPPRAVKSLGVVDDLTPPEAVLETARDWVLAAGPDEITKPWDRKRHRIPGGGPYSREGFELFAGAAAMVNGRTQGVYPAARAALSAIYEGALVPFDTALRIEARWFVNTLLHPSAEAMIRTLFLDKQAIEKGARRPATHPVGKPVKRLGVLGAGMMGAGIAHVAARAGVEVALLDADAEAAERGKAASARLTEQAARRGSLNPGAAEAVQDRITPGTDYTALADCDLIIEAVPEDPGLKARVLAQAEAAAGPDCVIASNTSTLPITDLARALQRPGRFLGLHFFSPVEKMLLIEVIRAGESGDAAVARALDFAGQIGKTPILVRDARFFYANRCIIPYLHEGLRLLDEGVAPALIENAARLTGMPVGPLQLLDEVSIELAAGIARATRAAMGARYPDAAADRILSAMLDAGRAGRKAGAGFYDYDTRGKRQGLWPGLAELAGGARVDPDLAEVKDRLLFVQALEAVRALEDGVLEDIREGNLGAVLGWGFAPWSGGPFSWLDMQGIDTALARSETLQATHGPRFTPPKLLHDMARDGRQFHAPLAGQGAA